MHRRDAHRAPISHAPATDAGPLNVRLVYVRTSEIRPIRFVSEPTQLHRALKARHLTMIAIGGSIGTGLFVASGASISQAGPGGAMVAYMAIGLMVYFLMTSLGEMAAFMPVSSRSRPTARNTWTKASVSRSAGTTGTTGP